ncbi:MAG: porin family protein [Chitinophagaceae bacterium]
MRKTGILYLLVLIALSGNGQAEFGLFAGPQITSAKYSTPEINLGKTSQKTELKYGFQAGGTLRVQFENRFYFSPAVFYSMKGFKVTLTRPSLPPDTAAVNNDVTLHTFELAPLFQYNFSSEPGHFFIKAGPSIDIQLTGREKYNTSGGGSVSRNMKFGFADYGRFGANLLLHLGYESAGGLVIFAHYTHGVGSIVNTDKGPRIVHRAAGLSIGKYFNRK